MMSETCSQATLLREVQQHIRKLEQAINSVSSARNHLKQSTNEVKSDIQSTMTHQLRTLRERELYLLKQVDLAEQAKDAVLQGQEDQLHETLGGLRNMLEIGTKQDSGKVREQVHETLDLMRNQPLEPTETPHIAFKANLPALNDAINSFGSVDVQRMPLSALFDSQPSATSLPRAFEEYDDEEHHVLYRTIGESSKDQTTRQISVTIPQLSRKPEDWLLMPPTELQPPVTPKSSTVNTTGITFPPFISENLGECLDSHSEMNRSESSAASIHQWLCDIQGQGDVEEVDADFEVISPSSYRPPASTKGSSIEILSMEEAQQPMFYQAPDDEICSSMANLVITPDICIPHQALPYFQAVQAQASNKWLLDAVVPETSAAYCNEILRYFREVSDDTRHWLHRYEEKEKAAEMCAPSAPCAKPTKTVDIENLDQLVCVQAEPLFSYFRQVTSDPKNWLLSRKDEDVDVDEADIDEVVVSVCKANEPCQTFKDCLCDQNCCMMLDDNFPVKNAPKDPEATMKLKTPPDSSWLLAGDSDVSSQMALSGSAMFPPFEGSMKSQEWILTAREPPCESFVRLSGAFGEIAQSPTSRWLCGSESTGKGQSDIQDLTRDWTAKFRHETSRSEASNILKVEKNTPVSCSQWLLKPSSSEIPSLKVIDAENVPNAGCFTPNKTVSWLLKSKEKGNCCKDNKWVVPTKQSELPECEDEPTMESQVMQNDVFMPTRFSCFQKEPLDKNMWLASNNMLIE